MHRTRRLAREAAMTAAGIDESPGPRPGSAPEPDEDGWMPMSAAESEADREPQEGLGPSSSALSAAPAADLRQLDHWLKAVVEQDERAFAALHDATVGRVFGFVRRIVRDAALAEEVVEDTYFQIWRQAARFDRERGHAWTWILSMARSRAIDAIRREARFRHEAMPESAAAEIEGAGVAEGADELLDMARQHAELNRALLQLGPQPRQLVALAFLRGLSHEEIAEQMRLPLGTVKSQIRRALLTLREVLGGRDGPRAPGRCGLTPSF